MAGPRGAFASDAQRQDYTGYQARGEAR